MTKGCYEQSFKGVTTMSKPTRTPHEHNLALMAGITPSLRYTGNEAFGQWQTRARAKLLELTGLPLFQTCPEDFTVEFSTDHGTFKETRFTIQTETGYRVPCHFCVPAGAKGPLPVAVCLQGHSKGMHKSLGRSKYLNDGDVEGDRDFAIRAMREGCCALVMEQRCFGESGGDPVTGDTRCFDSSMAALLIGRTTIAERVWDVQRALDATRHFPEADLSRVVCLGNSGGGTTTLFATCVEPRITHCMPSCYFCTFDASIAAIHHCSCNFVPNIRNFLDMGDMAGLVAPRPMVVVAGAADDIFPLEGVREAFETARTYYTAAGAPDNIALVVGDGGHRFYADPAWAAMNRY